MQFREYIEADILGGVLVNTTTAAICGGGTGKCLEYRMY